MPKQLWPCSGWSAGISNCVAWCCLSTSFALGTNYTMRVRLDPDTRILRGEASIEWTNTSTADVQSLCLHQYYNAWKNPDSSFLNSNRMTTRDFSAWREDDWAYTQIQRLALGGVPVDGDISEVLRYRASEDGNALDQTVAELYLSDSVTPGQTIRLDIDFENRVPRTFARTGYRGEYFFIAQWFPKLGVLQSDGTWHCQQFIQTEFFADFGTYDVQIEVPENWVVGATGQSNPAEPMGDGYVSHRFRQERVHDFAWTTSPDFLVVKDRFEHAGLRPVDLRLLLMPDHASQGSRYLEATKAGLRYYGEWFGEYPYDQLTIVDPAFRSRTGGMEYPTLFTGGTRWWNPEGSGQPESVTVHEFGHQIWYGVVANNEFEDAWMDEGFNTYSTTRVLRTFYGRPKLVKRYFDGFLAYVFPDIETVWRTVSGTGTFYSELRLDRMDTPSWKYGPASDRYTKQAPNPNRIYGPASYSINSYTKPALMLETLEGYLGWDVMQRVLKTYFERFSFQHPKPEDFFALVEEVSDQDLSWFWEGTYHSSGVFDYAVDKVTSYSDRHQVVLRRWGESSFPVEVLVVFESGSRVRERWNGQDLWKKFDFIIENDRVVQVLIDPERKLALDINPVNNSWLADDSSTFSACKWGLKWMIWLQNLLHQFAALA